MWTLIADILLAIFSISALAWLWWTNRTLKSYLSGYGKEKGKNLATHEDIETILHHLRSSTKATEEIKMQISSEAWDRQRQWELKREATFGAAKSLSDMNNAISALDLSTRNRNADDPKWVKENKEIEDTWNRVSDSFELTVTQVAIACSPNTYDAMQEFYALASKCAGLLLQSRIGEASKNYHDLKRKSYAVIHAIRRELGIEVPPQSTESSAGPNNALR